MTDRSSRDTGYVLIRDRKPKNTSRYYYDADDADDDDNESQLATTTRRVVRTKPVREQRIRYVTTDEPDSEYRRQRVAEPSDRKVKLRNTTNGEQVVLDEDNNVIKIIRNARSPTTPPPLPPPIEHRRLRIRPQESQTVYYQTPDGHLVTQPPKKNLSIRKKDDFVYAEDEPTRVVRKVIIDPRTGDRETMYEKDKPRQQQQKKYVIRQRPAEIPVDSDYEYEQQQQQQQQQPQYVQVVQRRAAPKQEAPTTKYVMIRKKVDSEPVYTATSSMPTVKSNRRIVYQSPSKKPSTTYVYSTDGKYYK